MSPFRLALVGVCVALPALGLAVDKAKLERLDAALQAFQPGDGMDGNQPAVEREKQNTLPKSAHPLWQVLNKCPISYSSTPPHITISLTEAVKAMAGKPISLSGFVLPMDEGLSTAVTKHFMLSQRTPTCTYCPPGEPNEVVEVIMPKPIKWEGHEVTIKGTFKLVNNTDNGVFYRIEAEM